MFRHVRDPVRLVHRPTTRKLGANNHLRKHTIHENSGLHIIKNHPKTIKKSYPQNFKKGSQSKILEGGLRLTL